MRRILVGLILLGCGTQPLSVEPEQWGAGSGGSESGDAGGGDAGPDAEAGSGGQGGAGAVGGTGGAGSGGQGAGGSAGTGVGGTGGEGATGPEVTELPCDYYTPLLGGAWAAKLGTFEVTGFWETVAVIEDATGLQWPATLYREADGTMFAYCGREGHGVARVWVMRP